MVEALGRRVLLILWMIAATNYANADVPVRGYVRRNGMSVAPHYRSSPNGSVLDNWSYRGNINPYTGKPGSRDVFLGGSTGAQLPSLAPQGSGIHFRQPIAASNNAGKDGLEARRPDDSGASALPRNDSDASGAPDSSKLSVGATPTTDIELRARIAKLEARIDLLERTLASNTAAPSTSATLEVAGPRKRPTIEQWRSIKYGMSMNAVEAVLGKPSSVENQGSGENWIYADGAMVKFFRDGTVFTSVYSSSKP